MKWVPVKCMGKLPVKEWILWPLFSLWTDRWHTGFKCSVCGARKIGPGAFLNSWQAQQREANDWLNSAPKPSKPPIKLKTSSQDREAWRELEEPLDFGHQDLMNLLDDVETLLGRRDV